MNNVFEEIAAVISQNDDARKLSEMNAKLVEVVKSYHFETKEALVIKEDTLTGLDIMAKTFTLKCKP